MSHPRTQRRAARGGPLRPLLAGLLACGVVAVLLAVGFAAQRYGQYRATATVAGPPTTTAPAKKAPAKPPGIGDPVRDGKFEFVVSRVDCSRTRIGPKHLELTADGKYCLVSLSVLNIADESQYFLGPAQKAYDRDGAEWESDKIAGIYANQNTKTFLEKLEPGRQVTGVLVFDVPKKRVLTTVELHDSLLSGGVKVAVHS